MTSVPPGLRCAPPLQNAGLISRDALKFETALDINSTSVETCDSSKRVIKECVNERVRERERERKRERE